ncbi:SPOR domain-containing protein [Shewanella pealeana]|uniref:Sporulation domain protein n=1 Tax=Shewanella pealeana (strain ATCC 700345 / ANG-SQ1) TaxID=398579 RepID=A8H055_SHEPA|nr:SPOR domain-containing protein [Shewanella pealeana]ABV85942.1 Sporulation domain protein [Shewanella pealeana ATCC 700345]
MNALNRNIRRLKAVLLVAMIGLTGCASQADIKLDKQRIAEQKQLKDKIEQLELELAEWHQMKAGLSRLIVIEGDLKLLVEQLTMLAGGNQAQKAAKTTAAPESITATNTQVNTQQSGESKNSEDASVEQASEPVRKLPIAEELTNDVKVPESLAQKTYASAYPGAPEQPVEANAKVLKYANNAKSVPKATLVKGDYALQLSSVDKFSRIEPTWFELHSGFGAQLGHYVPRYERVFVKGKTYYRIKVGQFTQRQQAVSACKSMQQSGLECIVATSKGINLYSG